MDASLNTTGHAGTWKKKNKKNDFFEREDSLFGKNACNASQGKLWLVHV